MIRPTAVTVDGASAIVLFGFMLPTPATLPSSRLGDSPWKVVVDEALDSETARAGRLRQVEPKWRVLYRRLRQPDRSRRNGLLAIANSTSVPDLTASSWYRVGRTKPRPLTNRLVRIVDRVREMLPQFEALVRSERPDESKMAMLFDDLGQATIRARVGQQALAQLYLGLGAFLATSIALGVVSFAGLDAGWMPLLFGAIGVLLLFSASILLIVESRIALASAYAEMDYTRRISSHLARPALRTTRGRLPHRASLPADEVALTMRQREERRDP